MVKDLFERIQQNKGPLGKWAKQAEGYYVFPKLEGEISNRMKFNGKEVEPVLYNGSHVGHGKYMAVKYSGTNQLATDENSSRPIQWDELS